MRLGVIRWNVWWKGANVDAGAAWGTLGSNYRHRQPTIWNPEFITSDHTLATVSLAREQEIADTEIQLFADSGLYAAHVWYTPTELLELGLFPNEVNGPKHMRSWDRQRDSALRSLMPWCWILQPGWLRFVEGDPYFSDRMNWIIDSVDEYYVAEGGRPLIYVFDSAGAPWSLAATDAVKAKFATAGLGEPYIVGQGTTNTEAKAYELDANSAYGPNGGNPAGVGHGAWANSKFEDTTLRFVDPLLNCVPHVAPFKDQRPRLTDATPWWDPATMSRWVTHLNETKQWIADHPANAPFGYALGYAWNEWPEWGGWAPTAQHTINGTTYGFILDGVRHSQGIAPLTAWWDVYNPQDLDATKVIRSGTWTYALAVTGAYDSNETRSSEAGAYVEVIGSACDWIQVHGAKGPDKGVVAFRADGGLSVYVNCYAPTQQKNVLLFERRWSNPGPHTVRATVLGFGGAGSSGAEIAIDRLATHFNTEALVMGSLSTDLKNKLVDHVRGRTPYVRPATVKWRAYLAGGVEVAGNGYTPLVENNDATLFPAAVARVKSNGVQLEFATPTGPWGQVVELREFDAADNERARHTLAAPLTVDATNTLIIPVGALTVTLSAGGMNTARANALLDHAWGGPDLVAEVNTYGTYFNGDPQGAGAELSPVRAVLANDGSLWGAASAGVSRTIDDIPLDAEAGATHWAEFSAAAAGTLLYSAILPAEPATDLVKSGRLRTEM